MVNNRKVDMQAHHEAEQILFLEARLLDEFRYDDWKGLLAPDIHYSVPARRTRYLRAANANREVDTNHYDDDYESLSLRLARMSRPGPSSMDPRPREVRNVSNIEVEQGNSENELRIHSVIILMRNRLLDQEEHIAARREDIWRRLADGRLLLCRRRALITHNTILMANMNSLL
jgi:ethylbenzene dioxygenase subunit beta